MVANPSVNQAAAVLITTLAAARAAGIPEHRLVFVHGGAGAAEPIDYLARDQFSHSVAQDAVIDAAMAIAPDGFGAVELYSCFPVVPKMARRSLGLAADAAMTVCGGLSFFGAPLNTYMTHATCAMVRHLRASPAAHALLYGQGGYVTKHHALVLGSGAPDPATLMRPRDVQMEAEAMRGPVPGLALDHTGPAEVETFTVVYDREGAPAHGSVIGLTPGGDRVFARIDMAEVGEVVRLDASPVGSAGTVTVAEDGLQHWRF
jgi:hypothetical protein